MVCDTVPRCRCSENIEKIRWISKSCFQAFQKNLKSIEIVLPKTCAGATTRLPSQDFLLLIFGYRRHQEGMSSKTFWKGIQQWNGTTCDKMWQAMRHRHNLHNISSNVPRSGVWITSDQRLGAESQQRRWARIEAQTMIEPPRGSTKDNSVSAMKLESKICVSFAKLSLAQSETDNIIKNTKRQCSGNEQL